MAAPIFYLLAYDISDDKRRAKIAKVMESVGERVQHSVFEAYLTPPELEKLLKRVKKVMAEKEDSLRIYQLCAACREKVRTEGQGKVTPPPGVMIVWHLQDSRNGVQSGRSQRPKQRLRTPP